ncbi:PKD domain-containing protein [Roseimarinus sediminis]|uniref:PKD domain-containing protein n=1 Tax=Roseimarinus sediminis TaxID=1610899 RepID=UPI003D1BCD1E
MKKLYLLLILLVFVLPLMAQTHFVPAFIGNGTDHMNIYVVSAKLGTEDLEAGDEIAAFDGDICAGVLVLSQPIIFGVFDSYQQVNPSKDEGTGNGYTPGNPISLRIWDASENQEYSDVTLEFINGQTGETISPLPYAVGETAIVKISATMDNRAPTANAGPDQTIVENSVVTLDGSASSDPDGDALSYQWTAPAGITLSASNVAQPTFTAPEQSTTTDYVFSLIVNDGELNSTADEVTITISHLNQPPVADAGPDQEVNEETTVTLDGSESYDPDGEALTYQWTAPQGITLSANDVAQPTFTAPDVNTNTTLAFELVVSDGNELSLDVVTITVRHINKAPTANAGSDQLIIENSIVTLDGSASSDPDGDVLSYQWTAPTGITLSATDVAQPTFTAPEVSATTDYLFTLVVSDGSLNSTADQITVKVKQLNKPPMANAGADQEVNEGSTVTLDGTASSDPDGDQLTYTWTAPSGITLSATDVAQPSFTAPEVTTNTQYTFSLTVSDGLEQSPVDELVVTVKHVNKIPEANAGPDQEVDEGEIVYLDGSASADGDGDALTYVWTAPDGITLSSTTIASPEFSTPDVTTDTNFTFTLKVNDGTADSDLDEVIVTVKKINQLPLADAGADQQMNEGAEVTLDATGSSDPDGDPLSYLWTAPAGITLSATDVAQPTFTAPEVSADTDFTFSLIVNDGTDASQPDEVLITVKQVNKIPVADAGPDQTVNEGETLALDGSASSDGDNETLNFQWSAPQGITLSAIDVAQPGFTAPEVSADTDFTFTLVVDDGKAPSSADEVVITVKHVNKVPLADAGPDQQMNEGSTVQLDGTASSDADMEQLSYAWTAPDGIVLDDASAAQPSFVAPEVSSDTDFTISLVVSDGTDQSVADEVVITVIHVNKAPVANAGPDRSVNKNFTVALDASASYDPDDDAITYEWIAPQGITLSSLTEAQPSFLTPDVTADTDFTFSLMVYDGQLYSQADEVVITVRLLNQAPLANAGVDLSGDENSVIALDGTASYDPDGDPITYEWIAPQGITLNDHTAAQPEFTAPEVTEDTDYTFELYVSDGVDFSLADEVIVTVKLTNRPPVANAGDDMSIEEGIYFALDGTFSSDPDGDQLIYNWSGPASITLSDVHVVQPTFTTPDVDVATTFTFTLFVNDGKVSSAEDQVSITVTPINDAPVANAGPDQEVNEGSTVNLDGSASSDLNQNELTYAWYAPEGITLSSASEAQPSFAAPEVASDSYFEFILVVNDGTVDSQADTCKVLVKQVEVNHPPVANAGNDQQLDEGSTVTLDGSASNDPDNDNITYLWTASAGITLSANNSAQPTFTAPEVESDSIFVLVLTVNDGKLDSESDTVLITVLNKVNQLPVADAGADQQVNEGSTVTLDGSASSDPDGDVLTYLWTAPAEITLSATDVAQATFTAPEVETATDFTFTLIVNDGSADSQVDEIVITVSNIAENQAPVANAGADQQVDEGSTVTLDGSASGDPDGDEITYLWVYPAGVTLSATNVAQPSFTAPAVDADTDFIFTLIVNDGTDDSHVDEVIITVSNVAAVNQAPVANAGTDQQVDEGSTVILDGSASSDLDGDELTYLWTAPAGITLSAADVAQPSFTAPEVEANTDFTFTLMVNDGTVDSQADEVVISVSNVVVNQAPVANAGSDQQVDEGSTVTLDGSASNDPDGDALTYLWTAPAGITLSANNVAQPSFTAPEVDVNTDFTFTLMVNDGTDDSQADEVVITVNNVVVNQAPVANAGSDQQVDEGSTVTLDGSASSDPDGDALTYLWTAPAGITLSANNVAQPSFTAPEVDVNTDFTFTLVVNDGTVDSQADEVVITVNNVVVNQAPVANAGSDQQVDEGSTVTLDGSASNDPDGDALSYLWTAPDGITLSANDAAQPTFTAPEVDVNTDFTFTLVVNDGTDDSQADEVVITVSNVVVNQAPVANAGADQEVKEGTEVTLDGTASSDPDNDQLSYLWTAPDGIVLSSATDAQPTFTAPDVNSDSALIFTLVVSDGSIESEPDEVVINVLSNTGWETYQQLAQPLVQIYPNPVNEPLTLKLLNHEVQLVEITLYGLNGRKLLDQLMEPGMNEWVLDLSDFNEGIYFIEVKSNHKIQREKILIINK